MIELKSASYKFEKIPTLVFLCVLPLLIALGAWQLRRADEKRALLDLRSKSANQTAQFAAINENNFDANRYKKVELTGHYDVQHQFFLDNQISGGKVGYFVLTPFISGEREKAVLVNRGWLPLSQSRDDVPNIAFAQTAKVIKGRINRFPAVGIKLPGAELPADGWPSVVQIVDAEQVAKRLDYPIMNFQVELDKEMPDGYKREWQMSKMMQPEQHQAYAVQWFGLALTLTVLFIVYSKNKVQ
jgi:surfeit locus 1 family protein